MFGRGPQRIWLAQPASAGCAVTDVLASTSATSPVVVVSDIVVGVKRWALAARKRGDGVVRVGRRVGRWEMLLRSGEGGGLVGCLLVWLWKRRGGGGDIPSNGGFCGRQSAARN